MTASEGSPRLSLCKCSFAVIASLCRLFHSCLTLVSIDDQAIVPVGEPECPVSTGVWGHNCSLVPESGPTLLVFDHDFHVQVAFFIEVPENAYDSFVGQPFVTNKD